MASFLRVLERGKHALWRGRQKYLGKQFLHYLHLGKTGGTAVQHALRNHLPADTPYAFYLPAHVVTLRDVPHGDGVLFALRDPVSRFVSGFYCRKREGQPRYYYPHREVEQRAFQRFSTANELALALSSSDTERRQMAVEAMQGISHVKHSYWRWFEDEEYFLSRASDIFFVAHQERLDEDFEKLKSKLGLPESAALPTDSTEANKSTGDCDRNLDPQAIDNLKSWYAADYRLIEICQELGW